MREKTGEGLEVKKFKKKKKKCEKNTDVTEHKEIAKARLALTPT